MADERIDEQLLEQLMWAIKNSDLEKVKEIVEQNKGLTTKMCKGRQPMCVAADFGQLNVLQFLVEHGADVNAVDCHNMTPLICAIYEEHVDCIKFLLSKGASKKSPQGEDYAQHAKTPEIKELLK